MAKSDKLLEKMRKNPRDWQIADLEVLAGRFGISVRKGKGSHVTFWHPKRIEILTVPAPSAYKTDIHKKFHIANRYVERGGGMNNHRDIEEYPFIMRHLSNEEGGGYLIEFPDLPGCISDGETMEKAFANGQDAIRSWIETAKEMNRPIPKPGELEAQSGKWVQRVPKSIHLRLVNKAKEEGVSLNTLVITLLAESLGGDQHNNRSQRQDKAHHKKDQA